MKPIYTIVLFILCIHCREASTINDIKKYIGKYEVNGMVVQVAIVNEKLSLIVPGSPVQELQPAGTNKFKSSSFSEEVFTFIEKNGKFEEMQSQRGGQSVSLKKISDTPDDLNKNDSLLTIKKSTAHFAFLYSKTDTGTIDSIAERLENNYQKITGDFQVKELPVVTVRIYPDLSSFHEAINVPGAPADLMATAFGKDDFRMASPNSAGVDSVMLVQGVTHEFTHVVHLNVDYSPNNPRWLWEGVAMYEANMFYDPAQIPGFKDKKFPPIATLGGGMEYMLGYVIIEAIKDSWGFEKVIELIKKQGNVDAVLKIDQKKFEEMVYDRIYNKYVLKK
jgi:hypothetical protein